MKTLSYVVKETKPWAPERKATIIRRSKTLKAAESFMQTWKKKYPTHTIWIELE